MGDREQTPLREALEEVVESANRALDETQGTLRRRGVVFDRWPPKDIPSDGWTDENFAALDPVVQWQGIAFSIYVSLASHAGRAEGVMTDVLYGEAEAVEEVADAR